MIFFTPKELMDLANGRRELSLAGLLFDKRINGVGGNEAAFRWVSRFQTAQTKLTEQATKKLIGLLADRAPIAPSVLEETTSSGLASPLHVLPWYSFTHGANTVADGQLTNRIPSTLDLVFKLDTLSKVARKYAETNDREALLQLVTDLPLSSTLIQDWVCERLKSGNDKNWEAVFFLLRVVTLFATLSHMSHEADEANDPNQVGVGQVFRSRDNETGDSRPFRPCFERLLEITGEATFDGLFKNIFDGGEQTRVRQGRKYMAAPPNDPKTKACSRLIRSAQERYTIEPSAVSEIEVLFFFARMLTGVYFRCGEFVKDLPGLDPNAVMDEWGVKWSLDQTEDADILRQMDAVLSHLHSSSE